MELHFRDFLISELFDTAIEYIDWGQSSGKKWQGIFFVPVKGMNPAGAKALREKQRQGPNPYAAPPGHIKYLVNIDIGFASVAWLSKRFNAGEFFTGGPGGQGHLLAQVWFKRQGKQGLTFERPGEGEQEADQNLVFGTVKKALEEVMAKTRANITGILFVSHTDSDQEDAAKRLRVYKLISRVVAPKWGFMPVDPTAADNEKDLLLIKKEFMRQKDQPPFAIPMGAPPKSQRAVVGLQRPSPVV